MKKILAVILALVCFMMCLSGCTFLKDVTDLVLNDEAKAKTFEFDGISIELTTDFLRMDSLKEDYDFAVGSETVSVLGLKMLDSETEMGNASVKEFAEEFHSLVEELGAEEITEIDGIPTFKYQSTEEDAGVAEQADARDLKSRGSKISYRFDPGHRHQAFSNLYRGVEQSGSSSGS